MEQRIVHSSSKVLKFFYVLSFILLMLSVPFLFYDIFIAVLLVVLSISLEWGTKFLDWWDQGTIHNRGTGR